MMKKSIPLFLAIFIFSITEIFAQQEKISQIYNDDNDAQMQNVQVDGMKTITDYTTLYSDQIGANSTKGMVINDTIEAGVAPEGDYMGHTIFSNDGNN